MNSETGYLRVTDIHKSHDEEPTLRGVKLVLDKGEIFCLLGPSGCGKTTLLRIIAGLETPDRGAVEFDGKNLVNTPPYKRQFSMMFQEFALFPHKNVAENIAFGNRMRSLSEMEINARTMEMLELTGLQGLENRSISELSGGERQRVALARSLAPSPKLLMLDEPMGSLDKALRERLVNDLRTILKKVDVTVIFVTHDQNEAFILADRIAVFNQGYIEQIDTPEILFRNPKSVFVAGFLGFHNIIPIKECGKLMKSRLVEVGLTSLQPDQSQNKYLLIKPEAARIETDSTPCGKEEISLSCKIEDCRFRGSVYQLQVEVDEGWKLAFHLPSEAEYVPGTGAELNLAIRKNGINLIEET